jgi:iron(III) transport system permease protein
MRVLGSTVLLVVSVTVGATLLAVPLAWLTTRTDLPGRRLWSVLHALPLVMPSYIYAFLFVSLLSPKGVLQQLLARPLGITRLPSIYGFGGAFIVLTLISYPYIFLTVKAALRQMEPTLLEMAQTDGARKRQIVRHVLLPYIWPAVTTGGLLVALYCLRDFGAVTLLQYSTFTRVIYNRYLAFQLDQAAAMATMLVLMTGVIMWLEATMHQEKEESPPEISDFKGSQLFRLRRWRWPGLLFTGMVAFLALFLPVGTLLYWMGRGIWQGWLQTNTVLARENTIVFENLWQSAQSSFLLALMAAGLAVVLALPIAILSARQHGRWGALVERISYSSNALPGIVVALAFVYMGVNYVRPLYQTPPLLLAAYMVLFVPLAVAAERSVLLRIPVELEEVGYSLGGSRWKVLFHVTLPLLRPGLVTAAALVFLTAMKELPATLLLSPLGFRTLPMLVWANISEAFFVRAAIPTLLLLLLSSVPLAWMSWREN